MVELTRRDALAALAGAGLGTAGCLEAPAASGPETERSLSVLVAAAEVVYPDAVERHREFVEAYALGRVRGREEYMRGLRRTTADLDRTARAWYGDRFPDLSAETRERVLRETGADGADPEPDPAGSLAGRIRYYVVEELLYALYTSPTGGRLVGTENPVGYPGGTASYQRGPQS